jgi:hypothetical protein
VSVQFLFKSAVVASVMAIASVAAPVHAASITSTGLVTTTGGFAPADLGTANLITGISATNAANGDLQNFVGVGLGDLDVDNTLRQAFDGSALKFMFTNSGTLTFDWNTALLGDDYVFTALSGVVANLGSVGGSFTQSFNSGDIFSIGVVNIGGSDDDSTLNLLNAQFTPNSTPVPTPALLPGLVGLGVAALRKRKEQSA